MEFQPEHFQGIKKRKQLIAIAKKEGIPIEKTLRKIEYEAELALLQSEFVKLQKL